MIGVGFVYYRNVKSGTYIQQCREWEKNNVISKTKLRPLIACSSSTGIIRVLASTHDASQGAFQSYPEVTFALLLQQGLITKVCSAPGQVGMRTR